MAWVQSANCFLPTRRNVSCDNGPTNLLNFYGTRVAAAMAVIVMAILAGVVVAIMVVVIMLMGSVVLTVMAVDSPVVTGMVVLDQLINQLYLHRVTHD